MIQREKKIVARKGGLAVRSSISGNSAGVKIGLNGSWPITFLSLDELKELQICIQEYLEEWEKP